MSLRTQFTTALNEATKAQDREKLAAVRLIISTLKDRDIAARSTGNMTGINDNDIMQMLMGMIKQRQESILLYQQGNRHDLVEKEEDQIKIIKTFLPALMDEAETESAIKVIIQESGAVSVKDMGKVMSILKEKYTGKMDMAKASGILKTLLG